MKHGLIPVEAETIKAWGYFPYRGKGQLATLSKTQRGLVITYEMTQRQADRLFDMEREQGMPAVIEHLKQYKSSWNSDRNYPILNAAEIRDNAIERGVKHLSKKAWL